LYFRTFKFGDFNALILDDRLLRVFQHGEFKEFEKLKNLKRTNAMSNYLYYLEIMHETAKEIGVSPENLEMFLFTFGNNLK
jgi:thermostable 8-oxoguanine DNA glycosylase